MASFAIFLRAVNVGGHGRANVADLAKTLGHRNIGAAGTFVGQGPSVAAVRAAVAGELGFETEIMVVPGAKVLALVDAAPLARAEGKPFVAVLSASPRKVPALPVEDGKSARLVAVEGPFALAVVLPGAKPGTSVTALVEKTLGVAATARGWPTMERVADALRAMP